MLSPGLTIALLLASPAVLMTIASFAWRKRSAPGGFEILLLLSTLVVWGGCAGIGMFNSDPAVRVWILKLQFIGIIGVAPALVCVALASRGLRTHTQPLGWALLVAPALCLLALVFTTEYHGLIWSELSIDTTGALPLPVLKTGVAFWILAAWSYLLDTIAIGLLVDKWRRRWSFYRGEALPVLVSIAVPVGFSIAYLASQGSGPRLDFTPVVFAVPALGLTWMLLFRDGMFDIIRFAQREILDAMIECAVVADVRGRLIFANEAARARLGIDVALPCPLSVALARQPRLVALLCEGPEGPSAVGDRELEVDDGPSQSIYDLELTPLKDPQGRLTSRVLVLRDITERVHAEQQIRALAFYDSLTGLPNRRQFQRSLCHALATASRRKGKLAILFLDLDRFKEVNDRLGHTAGDQLLKDVALRLRGCVRFSDGLAFTEDLGPTQDAQTVSRLAGDEFTILLTDVSSAINAGRVTDRIIETLASPFEIAEEQVFIGASIGIACYPEDGSDADSLMRCADRAMYQAKRSGRNRYAFFDRSMNDEAGRRHDVEKRLRRCLANETLQLVYQPIRSAVLGEFCGAEALLRAPDELGDVETSELIRVAENSGMIHELGRWVVRVACEDLRTWRDQGLAPPPLAVNASVYQLQQPKFADEVLATLRSTGVSPDELEIEIAEGAILANDRQIEETLRLLVEAGLHLVLDDFGTSHASLRQLHRFAFQRIKIDRSLIAEVTTSLEYARLTAAVIGMARGLRLCVAAEGVETEEQAAMLLDFGCDQLQGYLVGREMTAAEFASCLHEEKSRV